MEQVKRILGEEEEGSSDSSQPCSSEDEDIFEETAQVEFVYILMHSMYSHI